MKKSLLRFISVLLITLLAFTFFSCASNSKTKTVADPVLEKYKEQFTGAWFWDYGYDQEQFAKDYWYMYEDGTTYMYHIGPDYNEWDKGTWAIIDDAEHGPSLVLNVTEAKVEEDAAYEHVDAKMTFRIGSVNDDEFFIYRYRRDTMAMGGWLWTYDPAVEQHLYRVNAGARENLVGTWNLNMLGNYYDFDAETISFSSDGIYEVCDTNQGKQVSYRGTYDVSNGKNGTELHVALNEINEGSSYKELNPGFEVWFDYCSLGNDIIRISRTHDIIFSEEHTYDEPVEIYFSRDQQLTTYTYHWDDITITDYYPEDREYKLLDKSSYKLESALPYDFEFMHLDGWYTSSSRSGQPVTTLGGNDGYVKVNWNRLEGEETGKENERDAAMNVELWAKWSLACTANIDPYNPRDQFNYRFDLPASRLGLDFEKPAKGDTLKVIFSATASHDFNGDMALMFVDFTDGWNWLGDDWHHVETRNGKIIELFEIPIENDVNPALDNTQFGFNLSYNNDVLDEVMILSDWKFEVLDDDEAASRIADITYNYAGFTATRKAITGYNYYLPEVTNAITDVINEFPWFVNDLTFAGWYDNPEFTGEPLTVISAKNLKASTSIYGKFEVTTHEYDFNGYNRNDGYNWGTSIPAKPYISNVNIHAKAGETVLVAMSATLSYDLDGWIGFGINDQSLVNAFLGSEWHYVKTVNNKLQTVFPVTLERTANITSVDNLRFYFTHNPDNNPDKPVTFTDLKIEIVDADPFASTTAVTEHVTATACNEGIQITVHNLNDSLNLSCVYPVNPLNREAGAALTRSDEGYTFIWPFCEKGKTYSFRINYDDGTGIWRGEDFSVIAGGGVGEFDFTPFDQMPVTLSSNTEDTFISVPQFTRENLKKVYEPYSSIISGSCIGFVFYSCNSDGSDDCYEFESITGNSPDFEWYTRGLGPLLTGSNYSIFDDIGDWGVTRQDVINRFSSGKYVFTRYSMHFQTIYDNPDEGSVFYTFVKESNKVPFLTK